MSDGELQPQDGTARRVDEQSSLDENDPSQSLPQPPAKELSEDVPRNVNSDSPRPPELTTPHHSGGSEEPKESPSVITPTSTGPPTCSVCLGTSFPDAHQYRAHFQSDWHQYNFKAKLNGGQPVAEEDFTQSRDGERLSRAPSSTTAISTDTSQYQTGEGELVPRILERMTIKASTSGYSSPLTSSSTSRSLSLGSDSASTGFDNTEDYHPSRTYPYLHPQTRGQDAITGEIYPPGTGLSPTEHPADPQGRISTSPSSITHLFVPLSGNAVKTHPQRRYDEIERLYQCSWPDCNKSYGTLNHLNAHVTMQKHGPKRGPDEFKELRKQWRKARKESKAAESTAQCSAFEHS